MQRNSWITLLFIAGILLAIFYPIAEPLAYRFNARDSYYSHGYLIPFVSGYLIYRKRRTLKDLPLNPSFLGLPIILLGLLLHVVSLSLKINVTSYFSIPIVLSGITLFLGGGAWLRQLAIPLGFLIFMLPLPKVMIIGVALRMKFFASAIASNSMNAMGVDTQVAGSKMLYPGGYLLVGDPCSGLRSLITFLALGSLLTQIVDAPLWKRAALFLSVIPIAILSNVVRIMFLTLLSCFYGSDAAAGFWHDFAGMMVFILAFLGLIATMQGLQCQFSTETA